MENLQAPLNWHVPLFPPEVWGLIIDKIGTSEDIVSLLTTYPHLKGLSENKQFHWQISEILWLMLPNHLSDRDTLNCRLVCKLWKRTVDRLLEGHPRRLPYNSSRHTKMTERHFSCIKFPEIRTDFNAVFNDVMNNHVVADANGQNPFLGKYLNIATCSCENQAADLEKIRKITNFLKLMGYHIHHAVFDMFVLCAAETEILIYYLFQCLSYLPNLRSLEINCKFNCDKKTSQKIFRSIWGKGRKLHLPKHLETLDLSGVWFDFDDLGLYNGLFTQASGNQIKKFGVDLGYWNKSLARKIPNLTDLVISHVNISRKERINSTQRLRKMFRVLGKFSQNLKKLSITRGGIDIHKLFIVLQPCNIEMLELGYAYTPEKAGTYIPVLKSIKHIRFTVDDTLNMKFLKALPNLEYFNPKLSPFGPEPDYEHKKELGFKPREWRFSDCLYGFLYMNDIHSKEFNIWEELPNLKMITVIPGHEDEDTPTSWWRFVREFGSVEFIPEQISCNYSEYNI